jgi:hypothetical protein
MVGHFMSAEVAVVPKAGNFTATMESVRAKIV